MIRYLPFKAYELLAEWLTYMVQSVADVVEAIIGAAYLSGGSELALQVTKALKVPLVNIDQWSDLGWKMFAVPVEEPLSLNSSSQAAIEAIIDHKFSKPQFLWQALASVISLSLFSQLILLGSLTPQPKTTSP